MPRQDQNDLGLADPDRGHLDPRVSEPLYVLVSEVLTVGGLLNIHSGRQSEAMYPGSMQMQIEAAPHGADRDVGQVSHATIFPPANGNPG